MRWAATATFCLSHIRLYNPHLSYSLSRHSGLISPSTYCNIGSARSVIRMTRSSSSSSPSPHPTVVSGGVADVYMVPMFDDNYGHIIVDRVTKKALVVDPGDGHAVLKAVHDLNLDLTTILCTHKHGDHVGGNALLSESIPSVNIIATKYEPIPLAKTLVGNDDIIQWGSLTIRTLYSPCHTAGHVLYFITANSADATGVPMLFSGDTLFVGGCGRFFEGTPEQMLANMDLISTLPPETLVFCAHEYTVSNYKFLASLDITLKGKYETVCSLRARGEPTVPSTIQDEQKHNLFMRCRDPQVQQLVHSSGDAVQTMAQLRSLKNNFK